MARPSIHPILYQAEGGGSASVSQFDSVIELIDASQLGLPVGYYEVPGVWVTFWNGLTFSPSFSVSTSSLPSTLDFGVDFANINPDSAPDAPNMFDDFELS